MQHHVLLADLTFKQYFNYACALAELEQFSRARMPRERQKINLWCTRLLSRNSCVLEEPNSQRQRQVRITQS